MLWTPCSGDYSGQQALAFCPHRKAVHRGAGRDKAARSAREYSRSVYLPRHCGGPWAFPCFWLLWSLPLRGVADGHFDDVLFDSHAIHLHDGLRGLGFTFVLHVGQALKEARIRSDAAQPGQNLLPQVGEGGQGRTGTHQR